jgi:hypothetical protein
VTIGTPTWTGGTVINTDPTGNAAGLLIQSTTDDATLLAVTAVGQGEIDFSFDTPYGEAVYALTEGYLNGNVALGPGFNINIGATGTLNNYGEAATPFDRTNPTIFETTAGPLTITGFVATQFSSFTPIPGVPVLRNIYNAGPGTLTLAHNSASSTSGNRIQCPSNVDLVLQQFSNAQLMYIPPGSGTSVDGFWIVLSSN